MFRREYRHEACILQIPAEHSTMKESPMEKAMGQMSIENEDRYKKMFLPAFSRYVKGVKQSGSPESINRASGLATSGTISDMVPKFNEGTRSAALGGVAPNSGAMMMGIAKGRGTMGGALGSSAFGAKMGQRESYLTGLQNAVGIGKQQSSTAQKSLADVASMAQQRAQNNIEMDMAQTGAGAGALGALGGYALSQYAARK
jgi:hypothetical protein